MGTGFNNAVNAIALARDGSGDIYVGGDFSAYNSMASNKIIRLNNNGSADTAFAVGTGFYGSVNVIAPAGVSGDIYVGGNFTTYNGAIRNNIIRLNDNGSADTDFVIGTGFGGPVKAIALADVSEDIYVGGGFTTYNNASSNRIIRLNDNGSADTAFVIGTGFNGSAVDAIAPAGDGSGDIYFGGSFTLYNGVGRDRIIRLNADGSVDTAFAIGTGFNGPVNEIVPVGDGSGDISTSAAGLVATRA